MDFKFDSAYILYALGAILGIATFVYFSQELILNLSPTTKSLLLFLSFGLFFALGNYSETRVLDVSFYVLSAASYVVFLAYTLGKFDFSSDQTFLALGVSSVLFLALGYFVREKDFKLSKKYFKYILGGILVLAGVILVFDVIGAGPDYSLSLESSVDFSTTSDSVIGVLEVDNSFIFSRDVNLPGYSACISLPELESVENVYVRYEGGSYNKMVGGRRRKEFEIVSSPNRILRDLNMTSVEDVGVERVDECPEDSDEKKLFVYRSDAESNYELASPK